jgi:alkanesulfonate monooxygenase SsuD/methylene tetrahydromethanopterin reductase-like flavin-dependent oxidoreductase (luciferase family)
MVGGGGERKTLRLAAQYADATNVFFGFTGSLEERAAAAGQKYQVLRRHCEDVGRPYEEIWRTALTGIRMGEDGMSPAEVIALCRAGHEVGVQQLVLMLEDVHDLRHLETLGREVVPVLAGWG